MKDTLYRLFVAEWFSFYEARYGRPPKFGGAEGKALKEIITYMTLICKGDEERSFNGWTLLLNQWGKMPKFYQDNTDLKIINSKLNVILNELTKIATTGRKQGGGVSRAYMERVASELLS